MSRSTVLCGLHVQCDRAQLRGRLDGRKVLSAGSAEEELAAWLRSSIHIDDLSDIEAFSLDDFLRNTGHINLSADERLRQLAIFFEPSCRTPQPRGWLALDRVFTLAVRLAPDSLWLHHSRGMSAKFCSEGLCQAHEANSFRRIWNCAWSAANKAHSIDSTEPEVLYLQGSLIYINADKSINEALQFFDAAIEFESQHQWSLLFRAHCLQDLERWSDAAVAYLTVDPAFLVGPLAWRYELLLEQKAYCLFRSGDRAEALASFEKLLDRWINNPKLGFGLTGIYLSEVANSDFRSQLSARYHELTRNEDWSWLGKASQV